MATANGTQTTAFTYDHRNRLITKTDALGQIERYSYDNEDNMTSKTDRNGTVFTMTYNPMNQPLSTTAGGQAEHLTYTYTKTGAIRTEANETQTTTNFYDNRGFLVKQTESSGAQKQYAYDINGNRTSFVLFEGSQQKLKTTYEYDRLNRLTKVYENDALVASYTYDANGNRESLTYGNGITTSYSYNKANLVTSLTNSQGGTLSSYSYTYYNDGNQRSKTDHTGRTTNYVYDGMGRLKSEVESDITKSYTYDLAGNRATMTVSGLDNPAGNRAAMTVSGIDNYTTTYSYDRNNRLLTETKDSGDALATVTYTYDANGNQLSKVGGTLSSSIGNPVVVGLSVLGQAGEENSLVAEINTYNAFNQLTQVQTARHSVSYAYKADGLRTSKTADGVTTGFVWDGSNIVAENRSGDYQTYTRGIGLIRNGAGEYYLFDAHGDVVQMAGNGGVVREYKYDAFGNEVEPDEDDTNPFRYCGEYWDRETGNIYLRARYYNPINGRFTSEDPIEYGLNWYLYASNNPVRYFDPTGLKPGDAFDTMNAAARDFAYEFYGVTDYIGREIGAVIYQYKDADNNIKYSYNEPHLGDWHSVSSAKNKGDLDVVARIHTHPHGLDFSEGDMDNAEKLNLTSYVVTPNNTLRIYFKEGSFWKNQIVSKNLVIKGLTDDWKEVFKLTNKDEWSSHLQLVPDCDFNCKNLKWPREGSTNFQGTRRDNGSSSFTSEIYKNALEKYKKLLEKGA